MKHPFAKSQCLSRVSRREWQVSRKVRVKKFISSKEERLLLGQPRLDCQMRTKQRFLSTHAVPTTSVWSSAVQRVLCTSYPIATSLVMVRSREKGQGLLAPILQMSKLKPREVTTSDSGAAPDSSLHA